MPTAGLKRSFPKDRASRSLTYPLLSGQHDEYQLFPSPLELRPPILAVVIGINKYASEDYEDLSGAVGDADAFEHFLTERLHVPQSNILSLRDEAASRDAIINSFEWLRGKTPYRKNEVAMIFYYAGHGAQSVKPDEWDDWVTPTGNIEMLCPSDIGVPINANNPQIDGQEYYEEEVVQGIPDRTMSVLLNHVSSVNGNNITVILDCCSSAGMLRGNEDGYKIRRLINPPRITSRADQAIVARGLPRGRTSEDFAGMFNGSYVLLAACGREQFALEDPKSKRGLFTYSLLKALDSEDFNNLTYISLMHRLKIPRRQTPHCEGEGIYWRLFNNRVSGADSSFILTKCEKKGDSITLQAGSAQGVTVGSVFTAHKTNLIDTSILPNPVVARLVVKSVDTFSSILDYDPDSERTPLPKLFYSKLKERAGAMHIFLYSADQQWLESIFPPEVRQELSVTLVDNVKSCDLELTVLEGRVHFDRHTPLVTSWIGSRMRYTVEVENVDTIRAVVKGSLHFYYHLTRTAPNKFEGVRMELHELLLEHNDEFDMVFHPMPGNLIKDEPAKVLVNEEAQLGMTIYNDSSRTLYPSVFYFDPTELTIISWYMPPFGAGAGSLSTQVDAPLPPQSKLAIGYGDGGASPWQFMIPNGETVDLGFFRLFLSTRPAYFESILQLYSPFTTGMTRSVNLDSQPEPLEAATWAVQTSTVVQLSRPLNTSVE